MVDRPGRDQLAIRLRRLASGRITTGDFDWHRVDVSYDEALVALGDAGWSLYSDIGSYRLRGRSAPTRGQLEAVARCVLFLDTDLPYEWPPRKFTLRGFLQTVFTLGFWLREDLKRWRAAGPFPVWPFFRDSDYAAALANPRRFRGPSAGTAA